MFQLSGRLKKAPRVVPARSGAGAGAVAAARAEARQELPETPEFPALPAALRKPSEHVAAVERVARLPVVHNVVTTAHVGGSYDMLRAVWALSGRHDKRGFAAPVSFWLRNPSSIVLVFESGKIVCGGTKSEEVACMVLHRVVERLNVLCDRSLTLTNVSVHNLQSTFYMMYHLDLKALAGALPGSLYNPENIPHVRVSVTCRHYSGTMLVYESGRIVLMGVTRREQLVLIARAAIRFFAHFTLNPLTREEISVRRRAHASRSVPADT